MKDNVLIIGGGIAGLTLALYLKKAGIKSSVYESFPSYVDAGASIHLDRSGTRVLKDLGLEETILRNSHVADRFKVHNKHNQEVLSARLSLTDKKELEHGVYITRSHLIKALLNEAQKEDIPIEYGKKITSLEENAEGVIAYFEDGTHTTGSILVGCDGANSNTRKKIFPLHHQKYDNNWVLYGVAASKNLNEGKELFLKGDEIAYTQPGFTVFVSKSHPTDELNISWQAVGYAERKIAAKEWEDLAPEDLREVVLGLLSDWDGPIPELIAKSSKLIGKQVYSIDTLPQWSVGRVALIGDACHTTSPNTGFGATFALEDAMYLAKMLKDHNYKDAFYYYEFDRKERVETIKQSYKEFDLSYGFDLSKGFDFDALGDPTAEPYVIKWEDE